MLKVHGDEEEEVSVPGVPAKPYLFYVVWCGVVYGVVYGVVISRR